MSGYFFTREELDKIDLNRIMSIADYLDIAYPKNVTKPRLIRLIMRFQDSQNASIDPIDPGIPKYSVRVKRIMDMKEKGEL